MPVDSTDTSKSDARPTSGVGAVTINFRAKPIVVVSYPRSGTHLTIDGLRHFFRETERRQRFNQSVHDLYMNLDRLHPEHPYRATNQRFRAEFESQPQRVIVKTHCTVELNQVGGGSRPFAQAVIDAADIACVVRDVRPVLASYMALRPLKHPDSPTDMATFLRSNLDDDLPPAAAWAKHVGGWLDHSGTRLVKFEDMRRSYAASIERLGREFGLTRNGRRIRVYPKPKSIVGNKLRRVLGRQHCSSIDNLRMKIVTPNWREVMTDDDLALVHEQAGAVMERLGYDW
ncbi:MAG: sulfotransferase domain-containing protein [Phycisphaerales bacterium]